MSESEMKPAVKKAFASLRAAISVQVRDDYEDSRNRVSRCIEEFRIAVVESEREAASFSDEDWGRLLERGAVTVVDSNNVVSRRATFMNPERALASAGIKPRYGLIGFDVERGDMSCLHEEQPAPVTVRTLDEAVALCRSHVGLEPEVQEAERKHGR